VPDAVFKKKFLLNILYLSIIPTESQEITRVPHLSPEEEAAHGVHPLDPHPASHVFKKG
jgi:hypothetical protein